MFPHLVLDTSGTINAFKNTNFPEGRRDLLYLNVAHMVGLVADSIQVTFTSESFIK